MPGIGRYISYMVRVLLRAVRVDLQSNTPVLLLQETEGEGRTLPIFIGSPEATAIAYALQGVTMPRPLTHDLMKDMLGALDISVERVIITELRASTYYAEMHLVRGEERTIVSSRPSDAVAVAVRTESPLFVSDELMESEGIILALDAEDERGRHVRRARRSVPPVPRLGAPRRNLFRIVGQQCAPTQSIAGALFEPRSSPRSRGCGASGPSAWPAPTASAMWITLR